MNDNSLDSNSPFLAFRTRTFDRQELLEFVWGKRKEVVFKPSGVLLPNPKYNKPSNLILRPSGLIH
jgi:hypothetical protein